MPAKPAHPGTDKYSMAEVMVCEMARNLEEDDGTIGGAGAGAVLAMAANRLAIPPWRRTSGGSAAVAAA